MYLDLSPTELENKVATIIRNGVTIEAVSDIMKNGLQALAMSMNEPNIEPIEKTTAITTVMTVASNTFGQAMFNIKDKVQDTSCMGEYDLVRVTWNPMLIQCFKDRAKIIIIHIIADYNLVNGQITPYNTSVDLTVNVIDRHIFNMKLTKIKYSGNNVFVGIIRNALKHEEYESSKIMEVPKWKS